MPSRRIAPGYIGGANSLWALASADQRPSTVLAGATGGKRSAGSAMRHADGYESSSSVGAQLDSARDPRCGIDKNVRKQFGACGVAIRVEIRHPLPRQYFVIDQKLPGGRRGGFILNGGLCGP